jgi:hypothetical protein
MVCYPGSYPLNQLRGENQPKYTHSRLEVMTDEELEQEFTALSNHLTPEEPGPCQHLGDAAKADEVRAGPEGRRP